MARAYDWRDIALLVLLASIWSGSFLFIKVAVGDIPPLTVVAGRVVLGGLALALVLRLTGRALPRDRRVWLDCAVVALGANLGPFFLIAWGEQSIDSGLAAILMGSMPLSALLLAHFLTHDEKLDGAKLLGVVVGFVGVVVLIGPSALLDAGLGSDLGAKLAIVAAGAGYALGSIYSRRSGLTRLPPTVVACTILLICSGGILPLALAVDQPWNLTPGAAALASMLGLGLLSTGLAYVILFHLLTRRGVVFVSLNNYLVPLIGLFLGALILAEPITFTALAGLALILLGVGLVQLRPARLIG